MKKTFALLCLAGLLLTGPTVRAQLAGFNDIATWTGAGSNQSALVIQWNDGKSPAAVVWGYRWNGPSPTVNDMLLAVMDAGVGLFARGDSANGFGEAYYGFGYDANLDCSFGVTGAFDALGDPAAVTFTRGFANMNTNSESSQAPSSSVAAAPQNVSDRYREGWMDNGFWEMFTGTGTSYPVTWTASFTGAGEALAADGWYAFSLSNSDYSSNVPGLAVSAVPEPGTLLLAAFSAGILFHARKRLHSR